MKALKIYSHRFIELDLCTVGDYCGFGSIGEANLRVLNDQFKNRSMSMSYSAFDRDGNMQKVLRSGPHGYEWQDIPGYEFDGVNLIILEGDYSSKSAYLREPSEDECDDEYRAEFDDITSGLANYPVLNDDELNKVEQEWQEDTARELCRYDVPRALRDEEELESRWDALTSEEEMAVFWQAYERADYPEYVTEYNSGHWPDEEKIIEQIIAILRESTTVRVLVLPGETAPARTMREPEPDEQIPDENGRTDADFANLPSNDARAYVAAYSARLHHKGN